MGAVSRAAEGGLDSRVSGKPLMGSDTAGLVFGGKKSPHRRARLKREASHLPRRNPGAGGAPLRGAGGW